MSTKVTAAADPGASDGKNAQSTAVLGVVVLAFVMAVLIVVVGQAFGSDQTPTVAPSDQVVLDPSLDVTIEANIPPVTAPTPSTIDIPDVPLDPVVTTTVPSTTTVAPLVNPADLTGESVDLGGVPVSTPTGFVVLSEGETNAVVQRGESVAAFAVYPKSQIGNSAANKLSEYMESTVADVLVNVKSGQVTPVAVNGFVDAASVELRASTQGTNTPVYAHVTVAVAPDGKVWTLEYSTSTGTSLSTVKTELQQLFAGFFGAAAKGNVVLD